jgi:hypothetical protein
MRGGAFDWRLGGAGRVLVSVPEKSPKKGSGSPSDATPKKGSDDTVSTVTLTKEE